MSLSAQTDYNPDVDSDGFIALNDLLEFLTLYGLPFSLNDDIVMMRFNDLPILDSIGFDPNMGGLVQGRFIPDSVDIVLRNTENEPLGGSSAYFNTSMSRGPIVLFGVKSCVLGDNFGVIGFQPSSAFEPVPYSNQERTTVFDLGLPPNEGSFFKCRILFPFDGHWWVK